MSKSLIVFLIWFASLAHASGFVWEVSSPTANAYLIGTFHKTTPDFDPNTAALSKLLQGSNALVLEVDVLAPSNAKAIIARSKTYTSQLGGVLGCGKKNAFCALSRVEL